MRKLLVIMAKASTPGHVKTRLSPVLDEAGRSALNRAMLSDSVVRFSASTWDVRIALAGEPMDGDVPEGIPWHTQHGADLGERMLHAVAKGVADGYGSVMLVGSDHPTLPSEFIAAAFDVLDQPRSIVIGPSEDGGYYLLGMNGLYPTLFNAMDWSHADVFTDTVERAGQTTAELSVLPHWYDVDEPADLKRMLDEISEDTRAWPALNQFRKDMDG